MFAVCSALVLGACSTTPSPADVVEQPDPADLADPSAVSDELAQQALSACVNDAQPVEGTPLISTTVAPITSLVSMIAGDVGPKIEGIVPEGTNSHTYEPPPSVAEQLAKSDVVFLNGLMLEEPTSELAIANAPGATICEIGTAVLPESSWAFDFSFPREGGKPNPHIWTNPPMVMNMLTVIRDVLAKIDPANVDAYDENYVKASQIVEALDVAMAEATKTIPVRNRKLLTYHDAYAYFALHYDFDVIGAIQPQSFEEPSPQDIAQIIEAAEKDVDSCAAIRLRRSAAKALPSISFAVMGRDAVTGGLRSDSGLPARWRLRPVASRLSQSARDPGRAMRRGGRHSRPLLPRGRRCGPEGRSFP